jgi:hypothetical protein
LTHNAEDEVGTFLSIHLSLFTCIFYYIIIIIIVVDVLYYRSLGQGSMTEYNSERKKGIRKRLCALSRDLTFESGLATERSTLTRVSKFSFVSTSVQSNNDL